MTVNFDLLIAGCNTHCRHCYVGGGPGPMMKLEDALLFIEKLDALAELLPFEASLTLDNEPMNHPDIGAIIRRAAAANQRIRPWLARWKQNIAAFETELCTIGMLKEQLEEGLDMDALFRQAQDEIYMTVHQNGDLFVGNTGVETERIGNLRTLDIKETAARIAALPGNRDYSAFYEADQLPGREMLMEAIAQLPQDLLYSDRASALYRVLAAMGVPTRICDCVGGIQ